MTDTKNTKNAKDTSGVPEVSINKELTDTVNSFARSVLQNKDANYVTLANEIRTGLNSPDPVEKGNATDLAMKTANTLYPMLFIQLVERHPNLANLKFIIDKFYRGQENEGNGIQFIITLPTGASSFAPIATQNATGTNNVPTSKAENKQQSYTLKYFTDTSSVDNPQLTQYAFAFTKEIIINRIELLEAFRKNAGFDYIESQLQTLILSETIFKYDTIMRQLFPENNGNSKITQWYKENGTFGVDCVTNNPNCLVTGTAQHCMGCWEEIMTETLKFKKCTNAYNLDKNALGMRDTSSDEILIFGSVKSWITLNKNVKTQLYNASEFNLDGLLSSRENFITPNLKFKTIKSTDTDIDETLRNNYLNVWVTDGKNEYIDDNSIYVVDVQAFKYYLQTWNEASQFFAKSFNDYRIIYSVFLASWVANGKAFKYYNPNLNVNPSNI